MTLHATGVDTLFVTGIYTGGWVFTTVTDAWYRAYDIHLIVDAITDVTQRSATRRSCTCSPTTRGSAGATCSASSI